jgi:predicted double-glycine peptidase
MDFASKSGGYMLKIAFLVLVLARMEDRESLRFSYCTEQGFDDSCGLSALACLMDKYWNWPSNELSLATDYLAANPDTEALQVSLATMAEILEKNSFIYKAYQMNYEELCRAAENYAPLLVHYSKPIGHFALVLSTNDTWLLAADPAEGCICIEQKSFQDRWSGVVLAVLGTKTEKNIALLCDAINEAEPRRALLAKASVANALAARR